jgi:hypothetical protein
MGVWTDFAPRNTLPCQSPGAGTGSEKPADLVCFAALDKGTTF